MKVGTLGLAVAASAMIMSAGAIAPAQAQSSMSFFITSAGPGKGGDLGGLAGADRHCQTLAAAAGAGSKTWRVNRRWKGTPYRRAKGTPLSGEF